MSPSATQIQPWPEVRQGDDEHPVRTLQHLLRAHGATVAVDGVFGSRTDTAVRDLQHARGLAVDGVVGRHTWAVLIVQVHRGDHGEAVRGVQEEFRFRDLSGIPGHGLALDGDFGPATEQAVRGFQDALGIAVDGIVGPLTWRALVSGMLSF
jgi:peptidoglycan hydrolase-like protein with peptidoglycan-binding domain